MAKGQKRSNREVKKPKSKKTASVSAGSATTALFSKGTAVLPSSSTKKN